VSVSRQLSGESLPEFYKDSQVLTGFLEEPLKPKKTSNLQIVLNQDQRLVGKVEDAAGRGLPNLRIQISYSLKVPGLKQAQGYTVTHSGEEGAFQADGLGPGPYRVIASDEEGHRVEVSSVPQGTADLKVIWNSGGKAGSSR
jgi:hypothetical protein